MMAFLLCLPISSSSLLFQASASLSESLEFKFGSARLLVMEFNGQSDRDRKDHIIQEGNDRSSSGDVDEFDPWTAWLYKPRTVSSLLVGACFLIWASGALNPDSTASNATVSSVRRGVWAMITVFLTYCVLQAPSTLLIRPHPAVWRFVHGMAVVYLVALTFLLFQNRDDARQIMKYLQPELGAELLERSYGADCRIYVPENPKSRDKLRAMSAEGRGLVTRRHRGSQEEETLFDEFVLAHIVGWWGKAVMIRNHPLLWVLSIGFESMELTFRHMLPNFNECWWDSIILDILICNWFGIWAGMRTVRYFNGKTYEWVGLSRQPNIIGKVKRSLGQFTPARWDKDEWHPMQGPLRLILWWLIAIPTIREYNSYIQDSKSVKKVGAFCWLSLAICTVELLICIKFGHGLYPNPMPTWLICFWGSVGVALVLFLLVWCWRNHRQMARKRL